MQSVDVAIVGGGMVGLAVACGLQGSGLRVAVLEQHVPQPLAADAPPQLRVSAINAASEKLLTRLGVWSDIVARRACCYHGMEVWDKDSFGRIAFDDQSMGYSHLGHIVENSEIHYALWQKAQRSADITLLAPAELQQVAWGENEAFLTLKDGAMLTARPSSVPMALTPGCATKRIFRSPSGIIVIMRWWRQSVRRKPTVRLRVRRFMVRVSWHSCRLATPICALLSGRSRRRKQNVCSRQA